MKKIQKNIIPNLAAPQRTAFTSSLFVARRKEGRKKKRKHSAKKREEEEGRRERKCFIYEAFSGGSSDVVCMLRNPQETTAHCTVSSQCELSLKISLELKGELFCGKCILKNEAFEVAVG